MRKIDEKMRGIMVDELVDHYSRDGYFIGSWEVFDEAALEKIFSEMPMSFLVEEHDGVFNAPMEDW